MKTRLQAIEQEQAGSPAEEVLAEIGWLLVAHLGLALVVCLVLDACGA